MNLISDHTKLEIGIMVMSLHGYTFSYGTERRFTDYSPAKIRISFTSESSLYYDSLKIYSRVMNWTDR